MQHRFRSLAVAIAVGCSWTIASPALSQERDTFAISLPINGGTGYSWRADKEASRNVGEIRAELVQAPRSEPASSGAPRMAMVGGPQTQVFQVSATAPSGMVVLKLFGPGRPRAEKVLTLKFVETVEMARITKAKHTRQP